MNRQQKWQANKLAEGRCRECGKPRVNSDWHCPECLVKKREHERLINGAKLRYLNAKSYQV